MSKLKRNIVVTGFMGTGKTTVAQILAKALNRVLIDTDAEIERQFGKSIRDIFADLGEPTFRKAEADLCIQLCKKQNLVIATGGGMLVPRANFENFAADSSVFCLTARPATILARLAGATDRPLLGSNESDRKQTIVRLLADRRHAYSRIFHQIATDHVEPNLLAERLVELTHLDEQFLVPNILMVETPPEGRYPIVIRDHGLQDLGSLLRWIQSRSHRIAVIANSSVAPLHGKKVIDSLHAVGFEVTLLTIPDGESHKTLDTVRELYHQLLAHKISRHDTLVALGGGVTGDIVGFTADTYLRGIPFVQVPTTLLAMVDSSVGGKTGVDLEQGKNLVGAFKQPEAVLIDPEILSTLPAAEFTSGLAEVVKHAIIGDTGLFELLEKSSSKKLHQGDFLADLIRRAVRVKVDIVEEDPFEQDRRALLNLGHTFGHAIELVSNYQMRHGEAVAIGLVAASTLAQLLGLCDKQLSKRILHLLQGLDLPTQVVGHHPESIFAAMTHDKKRRDNQLRFILPKSIGDVAIVEVDAKEKILQAIQSIC